MQQVQQVQPAQQPIQQTSNVWVDTPRYNNGTSTFSAAAPTRQGFYNTTQVSLSLNLYRLFFVYDFLLFLLSYIRSYYYVCINTIFLILLHYKTVCFLYLKMQSFVIIIIVQSFPFSLNVFIVQNLELIIWFYLVKFIWVYLTGISCIITTNIKLLKPTEVIYVVK